MAKKVIDIFPPPKNPRIVKVEIPEKIKEKVIVSEEKIVSRPEEQISLLQSGSKIQKIRGLFQNFKQNKFSSLVLVGLIFLFLIFTFLYLNLSSANIEIWPEGEVVNSTARLTVANNQDKVDIASSIIPGQVIKKSQTLSDTFPTTGKIKKEKKAEGVIRVYNSFSSSAQALLVNTRFVSADGKIFKTQARATIPGAWYDKGKLVPGEIDIKVAADQAGPEYNITPTTFSIPGFAGTEKYTKFYGKSVGQMTGGLSEEVAQATEADLKKAEDTLTKKAKEEAESSLKNDLKTRDATGKINFEMLTDIIQTEVTDKFTQATAGAEMEKFEFRVGVKSSVLIFKKEDLEIFTKELMLSQLSQGKRVDEKSLSISFTPELNNASLDKIILNLKISAKDYSDIDISSFKKALQGKTLAETKVFLKNQPGVNDVKVDFWPFWVKRAPENEQKIQIGLNLDQIK